MTARTNLILAGAVAASALAAGTAGAAEITVTIENTNPTGGFFFTPFWVAAHDGGFDTYDVGAFASGFPGLTEIAEGGDTGPLSSAFAASASGLAGGFQTTLTAVSGPGDAPVFSPGESASYRLDVGDPTVNRFFSYASMVIPSNDLFVANASPIGHELFDFAGNFNGPVTIEIYGSGVRDNGTEVNDAFGGAAFSANGGADVDEEETIRVFFSTPADADYLDSFAGTFTATGDEITGAFGADDLIARITIVPAPGAIALLAGAGLVVPRRRRRG